MTIAHHPIDFDAVEGDFFELGTVGGETRWVRSRLSSPLWIGAVAVRLKRGTMAWLDASQGVLKAVTPPTPDPFGTSLAEALRREDEVVPHPVRRVETAAEKDVLWESIVRYARGG